MGRLLIIALLALPLAEIAAFVAIGSEIGVFATLALVLLAFLAGVAVLRLQGIATAIEVQRAIARDELPARALFDAACRVLAGLLLMLPGFVSDAVALLLLLGPIRNGLFRMIARHAAAHGRVDLHIRTAGMRRGRRGTVIEGEFEEVAEPDGAEPGGDGPPPPLPGYREDR